MPGAVRLSVDQRSLIAVRDLLKTAADGKRLQRVMNVQLKDAAEPIVTDVRHAILAWPSKAVHAEPLRPAIANAVSTKVTYSGRSTGVAIGVGRNMPRNFRMAGKRFNSGAFRHPVFDTGTWVTQYTGKGWFDGNTMTHEAECRERVLEAVREWSAMFDVRLD